MTDIKMTDIKHSSDMVFLFDGVGINLQTTNANRINARHNKQTATNILFFDGHAATYPTATAARSTRPARRPRG